MPKRSNSQPALFVEGSVSIDHAAHYRSEGATNLFEIDIRRKSPPQRYLGQEMEGVEAVAERAADWRERPLRTD
jgi:hypothetical protein